MGGRSYNLNDSLLNLRARDDPGIIRLRDDVRRFCKDHLPPNIRSKVLRNQHVTKDDHVRWQRILRRHGYLIAHWPEAYGGRGWSRLERWVFENEIYRAGSPWLVPFGITYVAPVIYTYGTEAQKERWLRPTANAEIWWAQGYSEPDAGSDLAQLRTRATRDGDHYVVSGQKTWTTMAQWADMMFALVRTDSAAKPQHGISFLLIDLRSPGVTLRPIRTIDNDTHVNEIFLDEVRVPVENRIGAEGQGWTYAKFLLANERLLAAEIGKAQRMLAQLEALLTEASLTADRIWRRRLAHLEARTLALESLCYELFSQAEGGEDPGAAASILKIAGAELIQAISATTLDVVGRHGLPSPEEGPGAIGEYLYHRAVTIYGGSSEIQRNILAKAVLGL